MIYDEYKSGQAIRRFRKSRHMTLEALGETIGVSASHLAQVEQGRRRMSFDLLFALMTVFKTDANSILDVTEKEVNSEVSIDAELNRLEPKIKNYLTKSFIGMIKESNFI